MNMTFDQFKAYMLQLSTIVCVWPDNVRYATLHMTNVVEHVNIDYIWCLTRNLCDAIYNTILDHLSLSNELPDFISGNDLVKYGVDFASLMVILARPKRFVHETDNITTFIYTYIIWLLFEFDKWDSAVKGREPANMPLQFPALPNMPATPIVVFKRDVRRVVLDKKVMPTCSNLTAKVKDVIGSNVPEPLIARVVRTLEGREYDMENIRNEVIDIIVEDSEDIIKVLYAHVCKLITTKPTIMAHIMRTLDDDVQKELLLRDPRALFDKVNNIVLTYIQPKQDNVKHILCTNVHILLGREATPDVISDIMYILDRETPKVKKALVCDKYALRNKVYSILCAGIPK